MGAAAKYMHCRYEWWAQMAEALWDYYGYEVGDPEILAAYEPIDPTNNDDDFMVEMCEMFLYDRTQR